jgi:DNA-binding MarR family transcriptional regulator
VDGLVKEDLIIRQEARTDRRRLTLVLTDTGASIVNAARTSAQTNLIQKIKHLSNDDLETIQQAMNLLQPIFAGQRK